VQFEVGDDVVLRVSVLVEGLPGAIESKCERVVKAAIRSGAKMVEAAPAPSTTNVWQAREALFADEACVAKVSVLPSHWATLTDIVRSAAVLHGVRWRLVGQWFGVGTLSLRGEDSQVVAAIEAIRERFRTLTILQCPAGVRREVSVWPEPGNDFQMMKRVTAQFDPKGTLAPGRFVGGI
jgi:glycolate oxidase FAD binding subunit